MNLNRSELDWVCDHLGHTVDVHRTHYRARSDVIERIEVAKLLLIQDRGIVNQFVGKTLKDIQFSGKCLLFGNNKGEGFSSEITQYTSMFHCLCLKHGYTDS